MNLPLYQWTLGPLATNAPANVGAKEVTFRSCAMECSFRRCCSAREIVIYDYIGHAKCFAAGPIVRNSPTPVVAFPALSRPNQNKQDIRYAMTSKLGFHWPWGTSKGSCSNRLHRR